MREIMRAALTSVGYEGTEKAHESAREQTGLAQGSIVEKKGV